MFSGTRTGGGTEPNMGEENNQLIFLLQVLLSEMTMLFHPTLSHSVSFTKQFFFMFYMNNSNLLIKITELSIEKVSN